MAKGKPDLRLYTIKDLHKAGVVRNTNPSADDMPPNGFVACKNTRFRQGAVEAVPGWAQYGTPLLDSRVMFGDQYFLQDGDDFLVAISKTAPYKYLPASSTWQLITPGLFSGGDEDFFEADISYDTLVVTNNKDRVKKWTGTGNFTDLLGLTDAEPGGVNVTQAKVIRFFNGFSILLFTAEDGVNHPQRVRWARQGFLETWKNDVNGNGQAGFYDLIDSPDWIQNAATLSDSLLIMKERSFYKMQYVGLPAIWIFRKVMSGIGLLAPRAWVDMGDEVAFLGPDNFYTFAGYSLNAIGDNRVKTDFFNDVDPQYANRIQAFIIEEEDEIWWLYPSVSRVRGAGEIDKAVVWNFVTKTWSFRDANSTHWFYYVQFLDYTWQTIPNLSWSDTPDEWINRRLTNQFPINLFGNKDGKIRKYGGLYTQDGAAYEISAESRLHDFQLPGVVKRVERVDVYPDRTFAGDLQAFVAHCEGPGDTLKYSGPYTVQMGPGKPRYFTCDISDVLFDVKFITTDGTPWRVMQYGLWFTEKALA